MGVLVLDMTVAPDGQVSRVLVHATSIASEQFQGTVQNLAQSWRFEPAPTGEVTVFYPLLFVPARIDAEVLTGFAKEILPGRYKIVAPAPVPIHKGPSKEAELLLGTIKPGLKVEVVSSQGGWLGVLSSRGKVGYIQQEVISSRVESEDDKHP